jgi:UDP-N-acetyl-D-galactosamine dehydrogenase
MKLMIKKDHKIKGANVLILGITFKENCPDIRNTKVIDIYKELCEFDINVDIYDSWASGTEVKEKYGINLLIDIDPDKNYAAIIHAVSHDQFKLFDFKKYHIRNTVIFDVKATLSRQLIDARL